MAVSAALSGKFRIGADMEVARLGFGSMRLTGRGIWGPPDDHAAAIRTLKRVPELGINFIDTADSYGPNVAEELIREALHPYTGVFVATKAGWRARDRTRVANHAAVEQLLDCSKLLIPRHLRIDPVQLPQIDALHPQFRHPGQGR
jgi:aryl-alcohol dehydrogenase-like predicted oxidoreductase